MNGEHEQGVLALVQPDFGRGFALAGVEVSATRDPKRALELLRDAIARREWGIILVEEALTAGWEEEERRSLEASTLPLVVFLPVGMRWTERQEIPDDGFVAALIRRAVGYQLNIQL